MQSTSNQGFKMKTCSRCKIEKSFDAFGKNKSRKDGYQHRCKSCCSCDQKKYREDNPEKKREANETYRKNNPEIFREHQKRYRENNPELKRENNKIYYAINKQSGL